MRTYEPKPGESDWGVHMITLAKETGEQVQANINGIDVVVDSTDTVEKIHERYLVEATARYGL